MRRSVISPNKTLRRELKIKRAVASRTSRCSFWRWNTMSNAWYYFSKKMIYQEKLRMQKWAVLHLISKHSLNMNFLSIFFMNYWWVWEVQMKNFNQNNFLFDVGQRDWSRIRVVSDVDEKWNEWKNMLMTFINKHAPVKKKRVGRKTSSWIT